MQEMWVQPLGQEDPLEQCMTTHYSILAWRIPGTEEPDRLQSIGGKELGTTEVTEHASMAALKYFDFDHIFTFTGEYSSFISFHVMN